MMPNIDLIIFLTFLMVNLCVGLLYSRGVTNIGEYALGKRNFSTGTLVATLVATWIGAGFFTYTLVETYSKGLYFLIPTLGDSLVLIVVGYFFIPRMSEFLGKLSIADAMAELFGPKARLLTVLASILASIGILGVQFKVAAKILELIFGDSLKSFGIGGEMATIMSATIVIIYSTFGGIRAVTFTDIIQFFTFGCIIPMIATIIWGAIDDHTTIINTLNENPAFNLSEVFDLGNPGFYNMLVLLFFFLFPGFGPMIFQRISMANNIKQASRAFKIAGLLCLLIQFAIAAIAILMLADNPNINPDNLVNYIINHYSYPGFKGVVAVGIMAMIMSTSDSLINSMSVIFAHDLCKPLGFKWSSNELLLSRLFAVFSGVIAIYFALKLDSVLNLVKMAWSFYSPIVSMPFVMAILGFRSSEKSVLIGMYAAIITVFAWINFMPSDIDAYLPGMAANAIFLFGSHYFLNQPGGWVGIKNPKTLERFRQENRQQREEFFDSIFSFNFLSFCKKNIPSTKTTFSYFGFFAMVSILLGIYTIPKTLYISYYEIITIIFISVLVISCYFLTYPIWPPLFQNEKIMSVVWIVGGVYVSVVAPATLLVISNLAQTQIMIFFYNILIIATIFRWQVVLTMLSIGLFWAFLLIKFYASIEGINNDLLTLDFEILYCLFLVSSILIAFSRPMQQDSEKKVKLFLDAEAKIKDMSEQMLNLMIMKQEFINSINHDIRNPIHYIGSSVYMLENDWDKMSEEDKTSNIKTIAQGYKSISTYVESILDLSELSTNKIQLKYKLVNLATIVEEQLSEYKKLYLENNENLHFQFDAQTDQVMVVCDAQKITQAIKHLIQNAAQYCDHGTIEITLSTSYFSPNSHTNIKGLKFAIKDEGVGIPENELSQIFGPFVQSSYTKKAFGSRGLGLALAERIIQVHKGMIWAQNNINKAGSTFCFILPLS